MGCTDSSSKLPEVQTIKVDRYAHLSPSERREHYIFQNKNQGTYFKKPGDINGQNFKIQDCANSTILLLDYLDSAQVDCCADCNLFIGPTSGSCFLRDLERCNIVVACRQFRTRNMNNCNISLYCYTQPIIEDSQNNLLRGFNAYHPFLPYNFLSATLDPFVNFWSKIYNFTPTAGNVSLVSPFLPSMSEPKQPPASLSSFTPVSSNYLFVSTLFSVPLEHSQLSSTSFADSNAFSEMDSSSSSTNVMPQSLIPLFVIPSYGLCPRPSAGSELKAVLLVSFPYFPRSYDFPVGFYDADMPPCSSSAQLGRLQHNVELHVELLSLLAGPLGAHILRTARMPSNTPDVKQQLKNSGACSAVANFSEKSDECLAAFLVLTTGTVDRFRNMLLESVNAEMKDRIFVPQNTDDIDRISKLIPS